MSEIGDVVYFTVLMLYLRRFFPLQALDIGTSNNLIELYEHMYKPGMTSFGVIGLLQPLGSTIPITEMQARFWCRSITSNLFCSKVSVNWFDEEILYFSVFVGETLLPSVSEQRSSIERHKQRVLKQFVIFSCLFWVYIQPN